MQGKNLVAEKTEEAAMHIGSICDLAGVAIALQKTPFDDHFLVRHQMLRNERRGARTTRPKCGLCFVGQSDADFLAAPTAAKG